jgi:mannose-6-phosphate isomerase-like protein (cupin superfamily)
MPILKHATIEKYELPGIVHQTVASRKSGAATMEVWMQRVAPGGATPVHRHDCEEVIVILAGSGTSEIDGCVASFEAPSTIIVPPNVVHRITNTGSDAMSLIGTLGMAPVVVQTPEGDRIPLPWGETES